MHHITYIKKEKEGSREKEERKERSVPKRKRKTDGKEGNGGKDKEIILVMDCALIKVDK
jgi:hypothetical protein